MSQTKDILTKAEAAGYLRISVRTLGTLIAKGELPAIRIGSRVLITREAIGDFIQAKTTKAQPAWRLYGGLGLKSEARAQ